MIAKTIRRDKNETIYNLQKFDDEIAQLDQDVAEINRKKKEALTTFDTVTRTIISDEITANNKEEIERMEDELTNLSEKLRSTRTAAKEKAMFVTDNYEVYIGKGFMTQETHLFHDSIANNIAVGNPGASREEIMEAAKKASIHDFIMKLPKGYDTEVGELGDTLSGGEKQRIGIARAFLHDSPLILMDEPTSNLDSLNEGIILKSLREASEKTTVVLVSHRKSTMNIADTVFEMKDGRIS